MPGMSARSGSMPNRICVPGIRNRESSRTAHVAKPPQRDIECRVEPPGTGISVENVRRSRSRPRARVHCVPHAQLVRTPGIPIARRHVRRRRRQLRAVLGARDQRRALPVRSADAPVERVCVPLAERTDRRLARLPAGCRSRPALRLPRARTVGSGAGSSLQSGQGPARSVRARDRAPPALASRRSLRVRAGSEGDGAARPRSTARRTRRSASSTDGRLRLAAATAPAHAVARHGDLRAAREGLHGAATPPCRRSCAAPTSASRRRRSIDHLQGAWRHGGRADADPRARRRTGARRARSRRTTGATTRSASSRRTTGSPRRRSPLRRRRRVQDDGPGAARRRARSHSRRRLQPHGRGRTTRARRCRSAASTTRATTASSPAGRRDTRTSRGTGNTLNMQLAARAAAGHGQPAVLGRGDARGRVPLRPRVRARARADEVDRLSAFFDVVQQDPVISRVKLIAEPWDVGEGGYQVGNFPAGLVGMERPLPRRRAAFLARRPRHAAGAGHAAGRQQRSLRDRRAASRTPASTS